MYRLYLYRLTSQLLQFAVCRIVGFIYVRGQMQLHPLASVQYLPEQGLLADANALSRLLAGIFVVAGRQAWGSQSGWELFLLSQWLLRLRLQ